VTDSHLAGLTVAVTGATGNVGTALLRALTDPTSGVAEVRGLARRRPPAVAPYAEVRWHLADLGQPGSEDVLPAFLEGADAVVHLAWALQPGRRPELLREVNVGGTRRVMRAAAAVGVAQVVHMSSLGAYAPAPVGTAVTEDWPVTGIPSAQYSRDKSEAEHVVREVLGGRRDLTVTVVRPTLVLQPEAAGEIGRYFIGRLYSALTRVTPAPVARVLPLPAPELRLGFVHADDVADAIVRMLDRRAGGPFNLTAEPLLDAADLAHTLGTRRLPVPAPVVRTALAAAFHARLVPTEPGWLDLGLHAPALDASRAHSVLGWTPEHRGDDTLRRFVAALGRGTGATGPLLRPEGGPSLDPAGQPSKGTGPTA
jgi:UDP-glucose 4-epimerase